MNYLIYSWISIWKLGIGLKKMLILTIFNLLAILKIIVIFSLWNVQVPLYLGISKLALNIVVFWLHDINFSALIGGIFTHQSSVTILPFKRHCENCQGSIIYSISCSMKRNNVSVEKRQQVSTIIFLYNCTMYTILIIWWFVHKLKTPMLFYGFLIAFKQKRIFIMPHSTGMEVRILRSQNELKRRKLKLF